MSLLDLTLEELDGLEVEHGHSMTAGLSATELRDVLIACVGKRVPDAEEAVNVMTLAHAVGLLAANDLPESYRDGMPMDGGRTADRYVISCALRFNWPPHVTRRQTLRDLRIIFEALEAV